MRVVHPRLFAIALIPALCNPEGNAHARFGSNGSE